VQIVCINININIVLRVFKKINDITKERFQNVLNDPKYKDMCINRGFRVIDNHMITYIQEKKGLSYYYDKRVVCSNGIDTLPLPI
jgi:hypothetical protein